MIVITASEEGCGARAWKGFDWETMTGFMKKA
jgi:hypothetical protein